MTKESWFLIRKLIRAEIESALEAREVGADGYLRNSQESKKVAERIFEEIIDGWSD